ncbi:MAG TPA: hypothetical protein PKD91_15515, partial [Bacteroidia bacterium]|nr:hypothetical protein [Bacteroidia bacterium]
MKVLNYFGKGVKITIISIVAILGCLFFFVSPILKYVIEQNSKEWVGRVITMEDLHLNIFSGKLSITGIKMMEQDDKALFFSSGSLLVNFTIYKFIAGNYNISEVTISNPYVKVIRSPEGFNFDDLTARDSTTVDTVATEPVKFKIENIKIENGIIDFLNSEFANNIKVIDFNFHSNGIAWDDKGTKADVSFAFSEGGKASL